MGTPLLPPPDPTPGIAGGCGQAGARAELGAGVAMLRWSRSRRGLAELGSWGALRAWTPSVGRGAEENVQGAEQRGLS